MNIIILFFHIYLYIFKNSHLARQKGAITCSQRQAKQTGRPDKSLTQKYRHTAERNAFF